MFEDELNNNGNDTIVGYDDENNYLVYFNDTKRTYKVSKDGTITPLENAPELVTETVYVTLYSDGLMAFSNNSETDNTKTVTKTYTIGKNDIYKSAGNVPWKNETSSIKKVIFANKIKPISTAYWFRSCVNITEIENLANLNTSQVIDMNRMFCGCRKLVSLDLSTFDTRRTKDMSGMFWSYADDGSGSGTGMSLTELNLSEFDTKHVTNMKCMFSGCSALTSLDVSNFDTGKVTNMSQMFQNCLALTSLDVSNFDTSNVTTMQVMFQNCQSLTSLDLNSFDTSNVTKMNHMFDMPDDHTSSKLKTVTLGNHWDTSKVTSMEYMFNDCGNLETIYVTQDFDTSKVGSSIIMFDFCYKLTGGNGTTYNSSKTDKTYARIDGGPSSSKPGYFTYKSNT